MWRRRLIWGLGEDEFERKWKGEVLKMKVSEFKNKICDWFDYCDRLKIKFNWKK